MLSDERIEQLELEVKVLRANNKGLKDKIDEQSKEIEELKEKTKKCEYYEMVADELYKNSVSKDKIKAKIEELQDDIKYSANPLSIDNSKFGIKVLQSLLEKEEIYGNI